MANFNLNDYETVEQRLARAHRDHPEMQVITTNLTTPQDRAVLTWIVKAEIWLPTWELKEDARAWFLTDRDSAPFYLKATGHAFEIDGQGMANKTSALENAETSAIGRALANAGYSGNKRTTREEMAKVERGVTPKGRDWVGEAEALALVYDLVGLRKLYAEAVANRAPAAVLEEVKQLGNDIAGQANTSSQPS